jgi:O-antigen ligase
MNLKKTLIWIILASVYLLALVPLVRFDSQFFPFITGKNFLFRTLVEVAFAAWAILAISTKEFRPKFTMLTWSVLGFACILGIANLFGENPYRSFWSNFERMDGYVTILHVTALFFVVSSVFKEAPLWKWFFRTSVFVSVITSIYAITQVLGLAQIHQSGTRVDATFGNSIYLAIYSAMHVLIAAYLFIKDYPNVAWRVTYAGVILLNLIALFYTGTRGTLIALVVGALSAAFFYIWKAVDHPVLRKVAVAIITTSIFLAGTLWLVKDVPMVRNHPILGRYANLVNFFDTSTQARAYVWPMAYKAWTERPILGWGQENFIYAFNKYFDPRMASHEPYFDRTHNIYLDWLVFGGIGALLLYLAIYGSAFVLIWRTPAWTVAEKGVILALFVTYAVHNLAVFDNITSYMLFFILLGYVSFKSEARQESGEFDSDLAVLAAVPVVVLLCVSLWFTVIKPATASAQIITALNKMTIPQECAQQAYREQCLKYVPVMYSEAIKDWQAVFDANTFGSSEAFEQISTRVGNVVQVFGPTSSIAQSFMTITETQIPLIIERNGADGRYHLFAGMYYMNVGKPEAGLKLMLEANELQPRKPLMLMLLSQAFEGIGDMKQAVAAAKQAYELAPNIEQFKKNLEEIQARASTTPKK